MQFKRFVRIACACVAVGAGLFWASTSRVAAQLDISGTWNMVFIGDLSLSCAAPVTQTGTSLSMDFSCFNGIGVATGTIDKGTGNFYRPIWRLSY